MCPLRSLCQPALCPGGSNAVQEGSLGRELSQMLLEWMCVYALWFPPVKLIFCLLLQLPPFNGMVLTSSNEQPEGELGLGAGLHCLGVGGWAALYGGGARSLRPEQLEAGLSSQVLADFPRLTFSGSGGSADLSRAGRPAVSDLPR